MKVEVEPKELALFIRKFQVGMSLRVGLIDFVVMYCIMAAYLLQLTLCILFSYAIGVQYCCPSDLEGRKKLVCSDCEHSVMNLLVTHENLNV